jgi:putative flippase GtrA
MNSPHCLLRYAISGLVATGAHYLVMLGSLNWTNHENAVVASTLGALTGMTIGYALNRRFTFRANASAASVARYATVSVLALAVNGALLGLLTSNMGLAVWPSQLVVTTVVFGITYIANRNWSFACQRRPQSLKV